jgi:CubicO group peptidase (beta-lactamase class C family)
MDHMTSVGFCPQRLGRLKAALEREVAQRRLPGAVVVVARHGQVVVHDAVGSVNPATGQPMPLDARFRIYSMTKPIVSVAAMMAVEEGLLQLADPVGKYLPDFAKPQVGELVGGELRLRPASRAATVHDLLRHTAGLTYEFLGSHPVQRLYAPLRLGSNQRSLTQFCQDLAALPLLADPGSVFEYSRATDVLGHLLEVVHGQSLADLLQKRVLGPLGMVQTTFHVEDADHALIAEPFARDPEGGPQMKVQDVRQPPAMPSGGGGLVSTAADYARFLQLLLNRGELGGQRLLSAAMIDFMTTDHLGDIGIAPTGSRNLLPAGHGFGLGFAVRKHRGLAPVPGSAGTYFWGGLAGTSFFVDPALDLFGILMLQAPNQREYYRMLFRNLVYASVVGD